MSTSAAVLCLALAAAAPSGALAPASEAAPAPAAVRFDDLPVSPPAVSDDARVRRFLGALAGGVVGLGAGLALSATGDVGASCVNCVSFSHLFFGALTPLLATTGTWLGFVLLGGDGGPLTPMAALAPVGLVALGLATVAAVTGASTTLDVVPVLVASSALLVGVGALALELRAQQQEALGAAARFGSATAGRAALAALVAALAAAGVVGLSASLALFSGDPIRVGLALANVAAGAFGVAAATWGIHRVNGGRGSYGAALAGAGAGFAVGFAGVALWSLAFGAARDVGPNRIGATIALGHLLLVASAFAPVFALEWSHTEQVGRALPRVQVSAAPLASGGGMVGAALRF